jgi:hypothetical protein
MEYRNEQIYDLAEPSTTIFREVIQQDRDSLLVLRLFNTETQRFESAKAELQQGDGFTYVIKHCDFGEDGKMEWASIKTPFGTAYYDQQGRPDLSMNCWPRRSDFIPDSIPPYQSPTHFGFLGQQALLEAFSPE